MNEKLPAEDWIDQEAALAYLGVSRPTLYRWVKDGRLRSYHAGRGLRFSRAELDAFLRGETVPRSGFADDIADAIAFFEARKQARKSKRRTRA